MARDEAPPLRRGKTETNGMSNYAGNVYVFEDVDYTVSQSGVTSRRTNRKVKCRLVKNSAAIALLPGRLVTYKAGTNFTEVDGYATTGAARCAGVVDEWLPSAGVAVGDYFFIAIEGPSSCLTDLAGADNNVITQDSTILVALTAATSGSTTAGRVAPQSLTGSSQATDYSTIIANSQNAIGVALSSKTTANTNASVLVDLALRFGVGV